MNILTSHNKRAQMKGQNSSGFTLVETLVAVAILMIAIAGPLVVANKGLTAALYARDQMIASFLAQEGMETVKNTRDNNMTTGISNWLTSPFDISGCTLAAPCDASAVNLTLPGKPSIVKCVSGTCPIYSFPKGYTHDPNTTGAVATLFDRHFYLAPINPPGCSPLSSCTEVQAHVIINWKEGTIPNQVDLPSELVDTIR